MCLHNFDNQSTGTTEELEQYNINHPLPAVMWKLPATLLKSNDPCTRQASVSFSGLIRLCVKLKTAIPHTTELKNTFII